MFHFKIFQPFMISLILGALLGFERAFAFKTDTGHNFQNKNDDILGGIRTYSLISLLGCTVSFLDNEFFPGLLLLCFGGIILLAAISYYISFSKFDERGITTEISIFICFLIGIFVQKNLFILATFITIISLIVLYLRVYMDRLTQRIESSDLIAVLKFMIITFVILPIFDPQYSFLMKDLGIGKSLMKAYPGLENVIVINPHTVWLMVVLISGIGFTGYVAIKILGSKKGIGLTGFLGGLVSSTATTMTFSKRSKEEGADSSKTLSLSFSLAVLLACSTMFPRVLVEVLIINPAILPKLSITMGVMAAAGFTYCLVLWKMADGGKSDEVPLKNPFNIMPAVKFGLLYAVIVFLTRLISEIAGDSGVYVISVLSGLTDVDAITLTMSQIAKDDPSKLDQAAVAITLAAFSNTALKAAMAFVLGSRRLRKIVTIGFSITVLSGIIALIAVSSF